MRVSVLYFGVLRDLFGAADDAIELADAIAVSELLAMLREILRERTSKEVMTGKVNEGLDERLWRSLAVAVNREYVAPDAVLCDGDEVALLPPVSGGGLRNSVRSGRDGDARNGRARC
jgi:molybdopterin converting factor small subunit